MKSQARNMVKIAKVFGRTQFKWPGSPVKSEQIAYSLSTYPLLYHAAVPLKSRLCYSMARGDWTFSGYSSIQLFQVVWQKRPIGPIVFFYSTSPFLTKKMMFWRLTLHQCVCFLYTCLWHILYARVGVFL